MRDRAIYGRVLLSGLYGDPQDLQALPTSRRSGPTFGVESARHLYYSHLAEVLDHQKRIRVTPNSAGTA